MRALRLPSVVSLLLLALLSLLLSACSAPPHIAGTVWQPDNTTVNPKGHWHRLGAHQLLVQWTVVDDISFVGDCGTPAPEQPDWTRIKSEPWAQEIIVGLAGRFNEPAARADPEALLAASQCLTRRVWPFKVAGWYFPVEIDPTWQQAPRMAAILNALPRPLWVSVYDNSNIGADTLADWLQTWLPQDVGIFFQDGVGVYAREPKTAVSYFHTLQRRLGKDRVRFIAEAFRPSEQDNFRPATIVELQQQLALYTDFPVILFEGPRYVSDETVTRLHDLFHLPY